MDQCYSKLTKLNLPDTTLYDSYSLQPIAASNVLSLTYTQLNAYPTQAHACSLQRATSIQQMQCAITLHEESSNN